MRTQTRMPKIVSRSLAVTVAMSVLVVLGAGGQALAAKSTKKANAASTLRSLVSQTQKLPSAAASVTSKRIGSTGNAATIGTRGPGRPAQRP